MTGGSIRALARRHWFAVALLGLVVLSGSLQSLRPRRGNPPELFEDELSGVVSAWSIATTGHDVGRTVLPFLTTGLELKQPMYFAATVPFQAVFGNGVVAVRAPAVLFGVLTTVLLVWLLLVLHTGRRVALIGGALFAVSPWAIHYARAAWEPAAYLPFAVAGIGLLWVGLRDHRPRWTVGAAIVFAFSAYTYHPALLMAVVMADGGRGRSCVGPCAEADLVALAIGAAVAMVILIPYGLALSDPLFLHRTAALSVFRDGITLEALQLAWSNYWAQWSPAYLIGGVGPESADQSGGPGPCVDAPVPGPRPGSAPAPAAAGGPAPACLVGPRSATGGLDRRPHHAPCRPWPARGCPHSWRSPRSALGAASRG